MAVKRTRRSSWASFSAPAMARSTDIVEAHTWFNLAASRWKDEGKRVQAASLRDELEKTMTPDQRAAAYRRATEWQDAHSWQGQSAAKPGTRDPGSGIR